MRSASLALPLLFFGLLGALGGEGGLSMTWNFNDGASAWLDSKGLPLDAKQGALKLEAGAVSPSFPLEPEKLYAATCRLKALPSGSATLFLKCDFLGAGQNSIGSRITLSDDVQAVPGGFRLVLPFIGQKPVAQGRLRLSALAGADGSANAVSVESVELKELPRAAWAASKYEISPVPPRLLALRGEHPRIFLTKESLPLLQARAKGDMKEAADRILTKASSLGKSGPPAYRLDDKEFPDQQLWQRGVGENIPIFAIAWLISGDRQHLRYAEEWAKMSCSYPTWGLGHNNMVELSAGHQLFGLAILYDWCYGDLSPELRDTIKSTLLSRGGRMFECAAGENPWWMGTRLQNHQWINLCGLSAAAFATWEDNKEAMPWLALSLNRFKRSMDSMSPDGASIEGVGYWSYGVDFLLRFMSPARSLLGEDLFDSPCWRNTAEYRLHMSLPLNSWPPNSSIVDLADGNRKNWNAPSDILEILASEYGDGRAKWLSCMIKKSHLDQREGSWLPLVWNVQPVAAKSPSEKPEAPAFKLFDNLGIVAARSSWSGDESLVVFKCGPEAGFKERARFHNSDVGHVHPDAGHFDIFGCGDWLVRDDGYRVKFTRQHNTLLVDGAGQNGEGELWLKGAEIPRQGPAPKIVESSSSPSFDRIVAEVAPAYPPSSGLLKFTRTLVFVKPSALLVYDDIKLASPKSLELKFHTEFQPVADSGAFLCKGGKAALRIEFAGAGQDSIDKTVLPAFGAYAEASIPCVKRIRNASEWRSLAVFAWSPSTEFPPKVSIRDLDGKFKVSLHGMDFEFPSAKEGGI